MAFFKDQFKANFYKKAFLNEAEKYTEPHTYLTKVVSWLHLTYLYNIQFVLHIVIATKNSNYGYNAWFINVLIYLFIISSEIFDKPTTFSFIYLFTPLFFHSFIFHLLKWIILCIH